MRIAPLAEIWRVLAYTLAIALAFLALGRAQLALFSAPATQQWLVRLGLLDAAPAARLQSEAAEVAAASREALRRLPPGSRMAAFRLGYELGFVSQWVGARAMSAPQFRDLAQRQTEPRRQLVAQIATQWGLGDVQPLGADSLRAFTELGNRYEADESGIAARVQQQMSPLHRQLFLLGAQLGGEAARIEDSGGQFSLPPATLIMRHATLAGIDAELWQPLAAQPRDEAPEQVVQRYRAALQALADAVARQDAGGPSN